MALIRWTPFMEPMEDFDRWFDMPTTFSSANGFTPAVDIWQDKDNVYAEFPLAGVDPKDVTVSVENDVLTIEGKSERKSEIDDKNYYRKEVRYGSFHRVVSLPAAVDGDKAKGEIENGILKVAIPKEERAKPKTVKVEIKNK